MKKSKLVCLALCGAVVLSSSGCYFLPDEEEVVAPPTVKTSETGYTTIKAERKDIALQVVTSGFVNPVDSVDLAYKDTGGVITHIYAESGDEVKEGDLICEYDTHDLDYQIKEKELYIRRAQLEKTILQEQGAMQSEIDRQQVEIDILENEMEALDIQKENAKLYAPMDGVITGIGDIKVGTEVYPGSVIATIIDPSKLYIEIQPTDITQYKMGMDINIRIDGTIYPGEVFMTPGDIPEGNSEDEDAEIVFSKRSIYIKFKDEVPENCVNVIADTILVLDERKDVVAISNSLIKDINGEKMVYLLQDGKKVAVPVTIGLVTGSHTEIISGVNEGDDIVIR